MSTRTTTISERRARRWVARLAWLFGGMVLAWITLAAAGFWLAPHLLAHRQDWPTEQTLARWFLDRLVQREAAQVTIRPPTDPRALVAGRIVYLGACSQCHGPDGNGDGWLAHLSYPPASALNDIDTQRRTDTELYWIIAHGLSFVGMPGFQGRLSDEQIWSVVAYIRSFSAAADGSLSATPTAGTNGSPPTNPREAVSSRGALLYVSYGCVNCHGIGKDVSGRLQIGRIDQRAIRVIREGSKEGMPAYPPEVLSDQDLDALLSYLEAISVR